MRVFVTGMGVTTSLGHDVERVWDAIVNGKSGIRRIQRFETHDLNVKIGGEIVGDLGHPDLSDKIDRRIDRATAFALAAARNALSHSGLANAQLPARSAVIIGSGLSGLDTIHHQTESLLKDGPGRVNPFTIPMLMPNASAAMIANEFQIHGPAHQISTACSSSTYAIAEAAELIQSGTRDLVVVGGTESSLTRLALAAFTRLGAISTSSNEEPERAVKPFDQRRDGLIMSEGAAILILESEAHLQQRGKAPLAEIIGWGTSHDAYHMVRTDPSGKMQSEAIKSAFESAELSPSDVAQSTYINAHGTATILNDRMETLALRMAFGESSDKICLSSTKSMTGHLIGAAGALETVFCVKALQDQLLPPTINYRTPDPECDLDCVPNEARRHDVNYALNMSFAFGGHNACLLLKR